MLLALFVTVMTVRQKGKGPLKIDATLSLISENWLRHFSAAPASNKVRTMEAIDEEASLALTFCVCLS